MAFMKTTTSKTISVATQTLRIKQVLLRRVLAAGGLLVLAALLLLPSALTGVKAGGRPAQAEKDKKAKPAAPTPAAAAIADPNEEGDDPDLPPGVRGIDKEAYLQARQDYINLVRGVSYDNPDGRVKAIQEMERQEQAQANAPELSGMIWSSIGPAPIPNGQTSPVTPVSGRTSAIAVDPTDPNIAYVGTAQGGVYRTLDGGTTWTAIFDSAQSLAIGAVAIAPSDRTILYVGTGEPNLSADSFFGVGLYRINNATTTADLTGPINPTVTTGIAGTTAFTGRAISKIAVHPTSPGTIFVSTASGTSGNPSGGSFGTVPPLALRGLYRSTNATAALGSIAFSKITVTSAGSVAPDTSGNRNVMDVVLEPGNANNLVCTVLGTNAPNDGGVYRTTNALAATPSFTETLVLGDAAGSSTVGRAQLVINNVASVVTVFVASGENSGAASCGTMGALRKSTDGGATWSAALAGGNGFCSTQCFYNICLAVDPNNANNVLLGGNVSGGCSKLISRSTDGGATFTNVSSGVHADNHVAVFAPSNPSVAYMGTDGGVYKSTNGGVNWTSFNNSGFNATQFQGLATHPLDRELMIGGTQDNGTEKRLTDGTWTRSQAGDGGYALIDQNATDTTNVTMYHTFFNQTGSQITWERSTNAGTSWTPFNCGASGISCSDAVLFYAPMALGPGNPNTLYFGTDRLYRSTTGTSMSLVSQAPITAGQVLTTIGISRQNDNARIVGLRNGQVFATTTGSAVLTNVTGASFPVKTVGRVVIDPSSSGLGPFTAYATFGGYDVPAGQHVWKTTNLAGGAATWAASGTGIPDVPVNALVVDVNDPLHPGVSVLYAGSDIGVYRSTDGGSSWSPFSTGLPRVAVFDIAIQPGFRVLRIATHGRGIWELALPGSPTAAKLSSFTTTPSDDGRVLIQWRTGTEVDNLGFNLYRDQDGKRTRITPQLVAGSALLAGSETKLASGNSYAWSDIPPPGSPARYLLEDIDLNSKSTWNGPIAITPLAGKSNVASRQQQAGLLTRLGFRQAQLNEGLGSTAVQRTAKLAQAALPFGPAGGAATKLSVTREGWYRVTQQELVAAGLDSRVNPRFLQLFVDGSEVPIIVQGEQDGRFDPADAIEFYGVGLDAATSETRVYWLVIGAQPGKRMLKMTSKGLPVASTSFSYTVERKDRTIYFAALKNGDAENFFGPVIAREPVDQSLTLQHIDKASSASAQIEVAVQGVTQQIHQVKVLLNGTEVGSVAFGGDSRGVAKMPVSNSALVEGENVVRLVATAGETDVSLLDKIAITYQHSYTADSNALSLMVNAGQQFTIDGFTSGDARVFDVTDPDSVTELATVVKPQKGGYSVTATASGAGQRTLLALTGSRASQADGVRANQPSSWRQPTNGADLIIVTHRNFAAAVGRLKLLRESQGLSVAVVDVEDIFDEFSYGDKTPQAIKDFLAYAKGNWKKTPRYVLLAGDASVDPKNYLGYGDGDYIPTKLIDTQNMETASDSWLADFDGNGVEELAIGRLPVRTAQEAVAMINKIVSYDTSAPSESILLVADRSDGFNFEAFNSQLRSLIPPDLRVEEIDRGSLDDNTAKSQLIEAANKGQKIVNYTGHGSISNWRGELLTNEVALSLTNADQLSLFVTMTCLNGYYQDPVTDSLAESLMKAGRGGAVSVWASSGVTRPGGQMQINLQLYRTIFGGKPVTVGEATLKAKAAVTDGDIRRTWNLLGDPSMKLK